jgi:hypothetical protein
MAKQQKTKPNYNNVPRRKKSLERGGMKLNESSDFFQDYVIGNNMFKSDLKKQNTETSFNVQA